VSVAASAETTPVPHSGDAADDPAIWLHPTRPARSTIIGTDKRGGLGVYDLAGRQLHYYGDSRPNNVDLRYGFPVAGRRIAVVTTSDSEADAINLYRVNQTTRGLETIGDPVATGIGVAGLCAYRSRTSGKYYVFVTDNSGTVQQWELIGAGGTVGRCARSGLDRPRKDVSRTTG
jgi:3-phytase